jgi:hypothetical protein
MRRLPQQMNAARLMLIHKPTLGSSYIQSLMLKRCQLSETMKRWHSAGMQQVMTQLLRRKLWLTGGQPCLMHGHLPGFGILKRLVTTMILSLRRLYGQAIRQKQSAPPPCGCPTMYKFSI